MRMGENLKAVIARDRDSVMPAASAVRTASAVGADTATISGTPSAAVFCTSSTETRLVSSTMPDASGHALARERAAQLVERIVPADVFAQGDEAGSLRQNAAAWTARVCRFRSCRGRKRVQRPHDVAGAEGASAFVHARHRPHRFGEALDAAQAAAGRPGQVPPPFGERVRRAARRATCAARCRAVVADRLLDDVEFSDVVRRADDAFGEAEADGEILKVLRRRHHDGVSAAVIGEGDRRLLRNGPLGRRQAR